MIDIIGAISLTALFGVCCAALIAAVPIGAAARVKSSIAALVWFASIGVLGATGIFSPAGAGTPAIALAILTPLATFLVAAVRSPALRKVALTTPLAVLVGIHAGRLLGIFFLLLFDAGRLPPTFAMTAGWGDIAVAVAALPLAWAIHRQVAGWQPLTLAWSVFGFVDLLTAVTLGIGSAPGSPVRFIFEGPNAATVATLPWALIPGTLVPLYLLTHLAIFAQLARRIAGRRRMGPGGSLALEGSAR